MWGRRQLPLRRHSLDRFTPTHVGNDLHCSHAARSSPPVHPTHVGATTAGGSGDGHGAVHPHACGDDAAEATSAGATDGSPPRMWGRRDPLLRERGWCGRVHPHACGGRRLSGVLLATGTGSPTHSGDERRTEATRPVEPRDFTPTHVGTTSDSSRPPAFRPVHPPTHVGTTRTSEHLPGRPRRFTPTHVGTTAWERADGVTVSVHPHACGDDVRPRSRARCSNGSPPRMWGRREGVGQLEGCPRFTPTHVGTTLPYNSQYQR